MSWNWQFQKILIQFVICLTHHWSFISTCKILKKLIHVHLKFHVHALYSAASTTNSLIPIHFGFYSCYHQPIKLREGNVLSCVCPSCPHRVGVGVRGYHVAISHDVFDLTVQGPPGHVQTCLAWTSWYGKDSPSSGPPGCDIRWPRLETCSTLFTFYICVKEKNFESVLRKLLLHVIVSYPALKLT